MMIQIEVNDNKFIEKLFEKESINIGDEISIPGDATLRYENSLSRRNVLPIDSSVLELTLSFGSGVASSLVASWIYSKLRNDIRSIRIERKIVEVDKNEIRKIIEERIKY